MENLSMKKEKNYVVQTKEDETFFRKEETITNTFLPQEHGKNLKKEAETEEGEEIILTGDQIAYLAGGKTEYFKIPDAELYAGIYDNDNTIKLSDKKEREKAANNDIDLPVEIEGISAGQKYADSFPDEYDGFAKDMYIAAETEIDMQQYVKMDKVAIRRLDFEGLLSFAKGHMTLGDDKGSYEPIVKAMMHMDYFFQHFDEVYNAKGNYPDVYSTIEEEILGAVLMYEEGHKSFVISRKGQERKLLCEILRSGMIRKKLDSVIMAKSLKEMNESNWDEKENKSEKEKNGQIEENEEILNEQIRNCSDNYLVNYEIYFNEKAASIIQTLEFVYREFNEERFGNSDNTGYWEGTKRAILDIVRAPLYTNKEGIDELLFQTGSYLRTHREKPYTQRGIDRVDLMRRVNAYGLKISECIARSMRIEAEKDRRRGGAE